jgi:N-acetylglucosamine malate deacetylase 1
MKNKNLLAYEEFVTNFTKLHKGSREIALGDSIEESLLKNPSLKVMLFSPHPDDECVIGALALRLKQEKNAEVTNVAVTLGSNKARQAGRLNELKKACSTLGFHLHLPSENALEEVYAKTKENKPAAWSSKVSTIKNILIKEKPHMVFFPHDNDYNSTHIGVNLLVMDAIKEICQEDPSFTTVIIETEFWQMMDKPNLMIGLTNQDEARLIYALSAHTEEVERNPYHINHPARMLDNVTRGAEVVGGQGGEAPQMDFAMIYRHSRVKNGSITPTAVNVTIGPDDDLAALL